MLECGISKLPKGVLEFSELQSLEIEKNKFKTLFSKDEINPEDVNLKSLTYLNVNGNQLLEIPYFIKYCP